MKTQAENGKKREEKKIVPTIKSIRKTECEFHIAIQSVCNNVKLGIWNLSWAKNTIHSTFTKVFGNKDEKNPFYFNRADTKERMKLEKIEVEEESIRIPKVLWSKEGYIVFFFFVSFCSRGNNIEKHNHELIFIFIVHLFFTLLLRLIFSIFTSPI